MPLQRIGTGWRACATKHHANRQRHRHDGPGLHPLGRHRRAGRDGGQRLVAVKEHLRGEETFLANYSDNLTDVPLTTLIDHARQQDKVASFLSVCPSHSFHLVRADADCNVSRILPVKDCDIWINGGFFVLKQAIFDHIRPGEELVIEPFQRLIEQKQLTTYKHKGFWACMDTFKEKMVLDDTWTKGSAPWEVWKPEQAGAKAAAKAG